MFSFTDCILQTVEVEQVARMFESIQAEQKKNEKSESVVTPFDRTTDATRQSDEQLQKW